MKINQWNLKFKPLTLLLIIFVCLISPSDIKAEGNNFNFGLSSAIDIDIRMDDGIRLKGLVYYPTLNGKLIEDRKFPVIVEMTPYPDRNGPAPHVAEFNKQGYIFLVVRPRGTGGSEGEVQQFNSREGLDGKQVAYWAAEQLKFSNGKIGLFGCSYPGAIALAAAAVKDPKSPIKAVLSACIGLEMQHRQVWTSNGMPNGALAAYVPNAKFIMGDYPSINNYWNKFYQNVINGGEEAYDGYWEDRLPLHWAKNIVENNIPVLLWGGWKDINEIGAVHAYTAFQNAMNKVDVYAPMKAGQKVSERYQLILGDWLHGQGLDIAIYIQWFDTWIKDVNTAFKQTKNPLHIYEVGTEKWINTDRYPLVAQYEKFYLGQGGRLTQKKVTSEGTAILQWAKPTQLNGMLMLETEAFNEGITLAGPMSLKLFASTNNTNLSFIVHLLDVSPNGDSVQINYGTILGSQSQIDTSKSWKDNNGTIIWPWPKLDKDRFLKPNTISSFDIALATRQYAVKPGHKLIIQITSQSKISICPENGLIPFTSEPCGLTKPQQETLPGGVYTIYFGSKYPSSLQLPILPFGYFESMGRTVASRSINSNAQGIEQQKQTLPYNWQ